ncbi:MAG: thioredoxin domain-containing protein [Deltaproteobacteria bacterium]|nr:thioredoxin domain-containing protein [Deltaproteobacteria bacterium]
MKFFLMILTAGLFFQACGGKSDDVIQMETDKKNSVNGISTKSSKLSCEKLLERHASCFVPDFEKIYNIPVGKSPVKGSNDALVTLVEFTDFQCPACKHFSTVTIPAIQKEFGDKIRIVFKHFPLSFHPMGLKASIAAIEVMKIGGNKAFWKFQKHLFANQDKLSIEFILETAKLAGVDDAKIREAIDKGKNKDIIKQDQLLGNDLGVEGTPWVYINGIHISRQSPLEVARTELEKAEKLVKAGTPKSKIYTFITDHGKSFHKVPMDKKIRKQLIESFKKPFLKKCEEKTDSPIIKIFRECSTEKISCGEFRSCFENKFNK